MVENLSPPLRSQVDGIINVKKGWGQPPDSTVTRSPSHPLSKIVDRTLDLCLSAIALGITSPVMLGISLAVYLSSGTPIFFRQKRLGKNGKLFTVYKFRTMRKDAEEVLKNDPELYRKYVQNNYKLRAEEDPRITKIGHFLRRSSLDELPQFLNVIRGDMSIVGPRPIVPPEIERYDEHAEEFLSVKPGITGLWQVAGRSEIEYPERKYLDLIYVQHKSLRLNLKIMLKTIKVIYKKTGAH